MSFTDDFSPLLAVIGVTELVGEAVYPGMAPKQVVDGTKRKFIVWQRAGGDPLPTLDNPATSLARVRQDVRVACYAEDYDLAAEIADAVFTALAAGSTSSTTRLRVIPRPPADGFDPDTRLYVSVVEASAFYRS